MDFNESRQDVRPLEGTTVIDLTQMIAGPFATMILGDLGAEVIKIENPAGGDALRHHKPHPENFDIVNRNKRSIAVDLKSEEGQNVVYDLLDDADVFVENTKPGRVKKYNLSYEQVSNRNAQIIYCSISGFGQGSPYEDIPAWDIIMQAMSGLMSITGEEDGSPIWSGLSSGDISAGMYGALSVVTSLLAREKELIQSEYIEVPMLDTTLSWNTRMGHTFAHDEPYPRQGNRHPAMAPFGEFSCANGTILVGASTKGLWTGFCEALDRPELIDDERFETMQCRVENRGELINEVESVLQQGTVDEWVSTFHEHETPAAPVYDTKSLLQDEHIVQRELHQTMERDNENEAHFIGSPLYFTNQTTNLEYPPPTFAGDTSDVLEQFGYTQDQIEQLKQKNVVGSTE